MPGTPRRLKDLTRPLLQPAWLSFVWFGLTAGISLLEAPVKFTAPSLTRPVALDVGSVVFNALNRVALMLLILLLMLIRISGRARELWAFGALIALIMIAQSAWLLPELTQRAASIGAGVEPPDSIAHAAYAVTEVAKLVTLLLLGLVSLATTNKRAPVS